MRNNLFIISCKSHEIYYPQQNKFIEKINNAYTKEEMLKMENEILKKLSFYIVYVQIQMIFIAFYLKCLIFKKNVII